MSKRASWALGVMLLATATAVVGLWGDRSPHDGDGTAYLTDRLWIERMPDGDRDMVGKLAVVRSIDHGRFGVAEHGSVWRHHTEIFQWRLESDVLHTTWPQDRQHLSLRARTRECEGEAPEPFELCLDLVGDGDTLTLYSRHDWVVRPRREGEDLVDDPLVAGWIDAARRALPSTPPAAPAPEDRATSRPGLWAHP